MPKIIFPPIENADEHGLVAIGGDFSVDTLLTAYLQGIFPWPISAEMPYTWFSPDPRGILFIPKAHRPKSFLKWKKKTSWHIKYNVDFEKIIQNCAHSSTRKEGDETWIFPPIIEGYTQLFHQGFAYCVGTYDGEELVGGLYGVRINNYVSGESMFFKKSGASKLALDYLLTKLETENIPWIDTQMVTPLLKSFGAQEVPRSHFLHLLAQQL
jgi:leucyl/phenylalanyl-tRNA--protein transferase